MEGTVMMPMRNEQYETALTDALDCTVGAYLRSTYTIIKLLTYIVYMNKK